MSNEVCVDGFPPTVTEEELKDLFSACGTVLSIQMATTEEGRSLRFATLEMGTAEAVEQAIQTLHHVELGGSILLVYRSMQVNNAHVFIKSDNRL